MGVVIGRELGPEKSILILDSQTKIGIVVKLCIKKVEYANGPYEIVYKYEITFSPAFLCKKNEIIIEKLTTMKRGRFSSYQEAKNAGEIALGEIVDEINNRFS